MGDFIADTFYNDAFPPINDTRLNSMARALQDAHDELNRAGRKEPVRCATVSNITLAGEQSIDSITPSDGDRVLVKDQTNAAENGIYIADAGGTWVRAGDYNTPDKIRPYQLIWVREGYYHRRTEWYIFSSSTDFVLGSTNIVFFRRVAQHEILYNFFSGGGPVLANAVAAAGNQQPSHSNLPVPGNTGGPLYELGLQDYSGMTTDNRHLLARTGNPSMRAMVDLADVPTFRLVTNVIVPGSTGTTIRVQVLNSGVWTNIAYASLHLNIATAGLRDTGWQYITVTRNNNSQIRLVVEGNTISAIDKAQAQLGKTYVIFR